MTVTTEYEEVMIDSLSWMDFERLCGRILEKSGYGKVIEVGSTQDGGRDVILRRSDGTEFYIECKFQHGSIGRPVVQKFHSAVITSQGQKGFLMVTGTFTHEAVEYSRNLVPPIDLIDFPKLVDMADRAGIKILSDSKGMSLNCFPASSLEGLAGKCKPFFDRFKSSPKSASNLFQIVPEKADLVPFYLVTFDIEQDYDTSVGRIYSIHKRGEVILLQANSKDSILKPEIVEFLRSSKVVSAKELPDFGCTTERGSFEMDIGTLRVRAKKIISNLHTKKVHYRGRNNQNYTKLCAPSDQSISLTDIKQVLLPIRHVQLEVLNSRYPMNFIENDSSIYFEEGVISCKSCQEVIRDDQTPLLCNTCGGVAHSPRWLRSHSYICHNCKKTICKDCDHRKRRFLIFRNHLCEACNAS